MQEATIGAGRAGERRYGGVMTQMSRRLSRAISSAAAVVLMGSGTTGCTAEKTVPGEMPKVDVNLDPGQWPEYRVKWVDVDVGTRERTITIPVVQVTKETREVQVPYIDINPPGAADREERTIQVDVDAPHAGYDLQITEVRASGDDLWVVAELKETNREAARTIARIADQVIVNAPASLDVRKVIIGSRPAGDHNQQHRFVDSTAALNQALPQGGRIIYQRSAQT
jgi:hypothetical protein